MPYTVDIMQVSASHAPIIGRGTIGLKQLDEFEYSAMCFFVHKNIAEDKKVEKVHAWVKENDAALQALTFPVFMACLCALVLSSSWEWEVAQNLLKKQGEDEKFSEWAGGLQKANDSLSTNPCFYITLEHLCDHILLHCYEDIHHDYNLGNRKEKVYNKIEDFNEWLRTVADIDAVVHA
ncbi:hypothetical protein C0995_016433 [Termitomyces sp. Mi166|nr:hypothetical protein C0995_016433 [Termitomyces sp. Mi166\